LAYTVTDSASRPRQGQVRNS